MNKVVKAGTATINAQNEALRKAGLAEDAASGLRGATNLDRLADLPDQMLREFRVMAEAMTGGAKNNSDVAKLLKRMDDADLAVRNQAARALYNTITDKVIKGSGGWTDDAMRQVTADHGPAALMLSPVLLQRYRQHLTGGGKAQNFEEFLDLARNDEVRRLAKPLLDDGLALARRIAARSDAALRAGARRLSSTHAERLAVLRQLEEVLDEVGEETFFQLLFGKSMHLIPKGERARIEREILDHVRGKTPLPEKMSNKFGNGKELKIADLNGLQGMAGEVLSMKSRLADARALAKEAKGPVYVMSDIRLNSQRMSLSETDAKLLDRLPELLDDHVDGPLVRDAEKSVPATVETRTRQEYTDGATVLFDKANKGVDARRVNEVKVSRTGVEDGIEQYGKGQEDILSMTSMQVSNIIEVAEDGSHRLLSLKEAASLSGAEVVARTRKGKPIKDADGNVVETLQFSENEKLMKKIDKLEDKLASPGVDRQAVMREMAKLRDQRSLKNFNARKKDLFVGKTQQGAQHGLRIRQMDARYEAISDTMYFLLFLTGMRRP